MGVYDSDGTAINTVYDKSGISYSRCYTADGTPIPLSGGHAVSGNFTRTLMLSSDVPDGTQGIACDSVTQTIAQLYTGSIYLIDVADGAYTQIARSFNLGHGNTGQFAPTKTSDQEYPLLYVSGAGKTINDALYTCLLEIECTSNSATMNKVYMVPSTSGLTGTMIVCVDFDNNIVYDMSASTYYGSADTMYVAVWDLATAEPFADGSYSPTPRNGVYILTDRLAQFEIPFIPEMQAATFFDGLLVSLSDTSSNKHIYFTDVDTHDTYLTIANSVPSGELEGIGFLFNAITEQYDMIVSTRANGAKEYYRYVFIQ